MLKSLSRSTTIMFIYDLIVLLSSSVFWYNKLNLPVKFIELTVLLTVLTGLTSLFLKDNYKIREFNVTFKNGYLLFEGCVFANIPAAILLYTLIDGLNLNITLFLLANLVSIYLALRIYRILFHFYLFNIKRTKNILVMGTNKNAKLIADEIQNKRALKMKVVGFFSDTENDEEIADTGSAKVYPSDSDLGQIIKEEKIDIIIVGIKRRMEETLLTKMINNIPRHVKVYKMPDFYEMVTGRYFIDRMSVNWLFYEYMNNRSLAYDFCKRVYDIIAAIIILTVTFPILLYIGLRVKLTDGGDIIYTQKRVGKGGKTYDVYKLRTMYKNDYVPNSENLSKAHNESTDDRVIPFCKWVRKARFDEIPQMINILKGDMSIVGPRAEWETLTKVYEKEIPYHFCRNWVKTGWTGWSHINQGHVFESDSEEVRLSYDMYYIKHRSVTWEIGILVKAIFLALGYRHE